MNLRTLKKHCKRAVAVLIEKHGYEASNFTPADGAEAFYAPPKMERRFVRNGFLCPGVLKGTPVIWRRVSAEYDEWDCSLPSELLADIEHWGRLTDEDYRAMAHAA